MTRTDTSHLSEFTIPNEGGVEFPQPPGSSPFVRIYLLRGCKRSTGLHWHETHKELLRVDQGAACLELDEVVRVITSKDGTVLISRGVRHQYWRADRDLYSSVDLGGEQRPLLGMEHVDEEEFARDLVVSESTEPADLDKEVYFRHIMSLLEEKKGNGLPEKLWMLWILWSFSVVFYGHDNFPVLVKGTRRFGGVIGKRIEWVITHSVLVVAAVVGRFVGLRSTYDEYTPEELRRKTGQTESKKQ